MKQAFDLVLRQAQLVDGTVADLGIREGRFSAISARLGRSDQDIDCSGKLVLQGLHDHHLHLMATAARLQSVDLAGVLDPAAIAAMLRARASMAARGEWLRATGYDERAAGIPDRSMLDRWVTDHPLRIQDRTGALWLLNSAAIAQLGPPPWPAAVETDAQGCATGRIWRGDGWLRGQIGTTPPSLAPLSVQLAGWGVTAVTDAGAQNGPEEAAILAQARRDGTLVQRLIMMGREDLPQNSAYRLGPVKLLFDERDFPDVASVAARIMTARQLGRAVAAHCVTEAELVFYLAALDQAGGPRPGDRIEHGGMIPESLLADIARAGLIVVANPGFIAHRGDRYLAQIDPCDLPDLQRLRSLREAAIPVLAGSDAPYGPANPWVVIRAAISRKAPSGAVIGAGEAVSGKDALALFGAGDPVIAGTWADCCIVDADWERRLLDTFDPSAAEPSPVQLAMIGGKPCDLPASSRGR